MGITKECHDELINWINSMLPPAFGRELILVNVDRAICEIPKNAQELTVKELMEWYQFVRKNEVLM